RRIWSIDDCPRNDFRLRYLAGEDVYAWFDRLLVRGDYSDITERVRAVCGPDAEYMPHQADLSDATLTYHYQIWGAEMGTGKTLAAQVTIERAGGRWFWVGPKTSLPNIGRELKKFGYRGEPITFLTYDALVSRMKCFAGDVP